MTSSIKYYISRSENTTNYNKRYAYDTILVITPERVFGKSINKVSFNEKYIILGLGHQFTAKQIYAHWAKISSTFP